jgi:hypothetical protein
MSIKILQNKPFATLKTERDDLHWDVDFRFDSGQHWDESVALEPIHFNATEDKPLLVISKVNSSIVVQSNKPTLK